jgi:CBS domain-containing protein
MWDSSVARDLMVTRLMTLGPEDPVLDGMDLLLQCGISGAPVVDDGRYVGVFSEKSCWQALNQMSEELSDSDQLRFQHVTARDIMRTDLVVFLPDADTLEATDRLISHRVSGGPVLNRDGEWLGSFSEHTAMKALLDMAMHQTPPGTVSSYMDADRARLVTPETQLSQMIEQFQETKYRRFPVVDHGRLIGQISRRDVLQAALGWLVGSVENDPQGLTGNRQTHVPSSGRALLVRDVYSDDAATIEEDFDFLRIVRLFHDTSARRLPVLHGDRVVGQVSRRDILKSAIQIFPEVRSAGNVPQPLYLSSSGGPFPHSS